MRRFHWRHWEDETALYDDVSGDTHLLDRLSAEVLNCLDHVAGPMSCEEIAGQIAGAAHVGPNDENLLSNVRSIIEKFHRLELIVPVR